MNAKSALLLPALLAALVTGAPVRGAEGDPPSARALLELMADAYQSRSFSGHFLYQRAGSLRTLELERAVIDGRVYERMMSLQGPAREVIRSDGRTVSVHPDDSVTLLSSDVDIAPLDTRPGEPGRIVDHYTPHLAGEGRVAGRTAWRVQLEPRDQHRYGYRLWLDQQSGLLLKSEILNGQHSALERMEFISLELDPELKREDFALPDAAQNAPEDAVDARDSLRIRPGWLPGGFGRAARDEHRLEGRTGVLHSTTFSDGLSAFTLFVEPAPAAKADGEVRRQGPTVILGRPLNRAGRSYRATLVGEVPARTAQRVLKGVSLEPADD